MARTRCRRCGIKYGSTLAACPHCAETERTPPRRRAKWFAVALIPIIALIGTVALTAYRKPQKPPRQPLPTLNQLLAMSHEELAAQDLAAVNLACAEGLYGAENLDKELCIRRLDDWAASAGRLLKEREFVFHAAPGKFGNSINRWKCASVVSFLNQKVGLSYNPAWKNWRSMEAFDTRFYRDSRDFQIHGLIMETNRGTCASMPVVFTCVARRLGFPIQLVTTRCHLFARWESPEETFNIEATDRFAEFKPDKFYESFPATLQPGEAQRRGHLIALTPERQLSAFLHLRAMCLWNHDRLSEARETFLQSTRLDPVYMKQGMANGYVFEVTCEIQEGGFNRRSIR